MQQWDHAWERERAGLLRRIITGTNHGKMVQICVRCGGESPVPHGQSSWEALQAWECQTCQRSEDERGRRRRRSERAIISIAEALDSAERRVISIYDALQPEDEAETSTAEPFPTTVGTEAHYEPRDDAIICQGCSRGSSMHADGWRICRCGAAYCNFCASGPCHDCAVRCVWGFAMDTDSDDGKIKEGEHESIPTMGYEVEKITPEEAQTRRVNAIESHLEHLRRRREEGHKERRRQTASGDRPSRAQRRQAAVRIITANVNSVSRAQEELTSGTLFKTADILLLQEHKARGEQRDRMEQWGCGVGRRLCQAQEEWRWYSGHRGRRRHTARGQRQRRS